MSAIACPGCGRRVSAYAAGCEHCGADLDRHRRAGRPVRRVRGIDWGVTRTEVVVLVVAAFFAFFVPVLGLVFAVIGLWDRHGADRRGPAIAFAALLLVAGWLSVRPLIGL